MDDSICPKCKSPKKSSGDGRLTQWLLDAIVKLGRQANQLARTTEGVSVESVRTLFAVAEAAFYAGAIEYSEEVYLEIINISNQLLKKKELLKANETIVPNLRSGYIAHCYLRLGNIEAKLQDGKGFLAKD